MKKTILIIEDHVPTNMLLKTILKKEGYCIINATHGKEAYDLIVHNKIHIMILDVELPIMTGIELLKLLKREGRVIPSILITGRDDIDLNGLKDLGVLGHLKKPFKLEDIVEIVGKAI
ncbi:MAG: response regulator [Bacteriovoracaceae bacterium]|nr:response regulator [Bacteriovoracaceae bacterium]